jgi:DNA-binding MarR family transcriptional regulator
MDAVFFSLKRGFHATLRCGRPLLARFGLTPARFDVLYALSDSRISTTQSELRKALGVARATLCEMLGALERLKWIIRSRDRNDRRTHQVTLSAAGRDVLERAYAGSVSSGLVPVSVDAALSVRDPLVDTFEIQEYLLDICQRIRKFFGDTATRELYAWHPDEYLSALAGVARESNRLIPIESRS